jgi:aspartate racemase
MKKIGLIGGVSWVSTVDYYQMINQGVNDKLGGLNFAECLIHSFNYADIKRNNDANDWEATFKMASAAAENMKQGGAEALVLCASTLHMIADRLQHHIGIPVIHIATATANSITRNGLKKVGLLGTRFTMEEAFFKSKLAAQNIDVLIPELDDRIFMLDTIYNELGKGIIKPETKARYISIINGLIAQGAEAVILGCTEIPMLIKPEDVTVMVFNTTELHAQAAVEFMVG